MFFIISLRHRGDIDIEYEDSLIDKKPLIDICTEYVAVFNSLT